MSRRAKAKRERIGEGGELPSWILTDLPKETPPPDADQEPASTDKASDAGVKQDGTSRTATAQG